ncbi:MAG: tail fiber protein [Flavobacteriales bacterium]|nr:tail fiber protein [Flavobacteriales bacterium]
MNAIGSPAAGLLIYNTDSSAFFYNNGSGWSNIASAGATQFAVPAGSIISFAGDTAQVPAGFLLCNGASLATASYSELFSAIGYAWGGSGSNFNLPDLRGRFLRGTNLGAGNDPDAAGRSAINTGGNTGDKVGSVQGNQIQSHSHRVWGKTSTGASYNDPLNFPTSGITGESTVGAEGWFTQYIESTGGNETRPVNANVNYIICYSSSIAAAGTNSSVFQGSISSAQLPNSVKDSSRITDNDGSAKVQALSSDRIIFTTNSTEVMRITTAGKVGIGTTSPQVPLHIRGGNDASLNASNGYLVIGNTSGTNVVFDDNEILARNNGSTSFLALQANGGAITMHAGTNDVNQWGIFLDDGGLLLGDTLTANRSKLRVAGKVLADTLSILGGVQLPSNKGTNGHFLQTDGSGVASWQSVPSSADGNGIYDGSGSLTGNTVISAGGNNLSVTSTAAFSVDGNTFNVDAGFNRVGIGTNGPQTELHVVGDLKLDGGGDALYLANGNNLGWGTIGVADGNGRFNIYENAFNEGDNYINAEEASRIKLHSDGISFYTAPAGTAGGSISWDERMKVLNSGKVGIGTSSPDSLFEVGGGMEAAAIRLSSGAALNKVLTSDANGNASWQDSQGDNLGNHTATTNLNMNSKAISDVASMDVGNNTLAGTVGVQSSEPNTINLVSTNNSDSTGITFQNPGGNYAWKIHRQGGANPDIVFAGGSNQVGFAGLPEKMRLTSGGNLGIGVTNPQARLHVNNSIFLEGNNTARIDNFKSTGRAILRLFSDFNGTNGGAAISLFSGLDNTYPYQIRMFTGSTNNGVPRMMIDSSGKVGIGTVTPSDAMEVVGGIDADSISVEELNSPSTGSVNLLPAAMGRIAGGGGITNGTGNFTVTNPSTGKYVITFSNFSAFNSNCVAMVAPEANGNGRTATYDFSSGKLEVYIWQSNTNSLVDNPFSFILYKN